MPQNSPVNPKNNRLILAVLILCVCFFVGAECFIDPPTANTDITSVAAEPTPSPTPFPTKEPKETPVSEDPEDPYPELYGDNPGQQFAPIEQQIVYLTFDDGPSNSTPALLDMLKEEGVPATFFVFEDDFPEYIRQIHEDGHTLGVHTHSHIYEELYQDKNAFLDDFSQCYQNILNTTGYRPRIFRFPGGSVNSYNKHLIRDLVTEMESRGFVYYDWNVTNEDASSAKTYKEQMAALMTYSENKPRIIVLMHDTDKNYWIADLVREYIHIMRERGYRFASLDSSVEPIHFPMP